MAFDTIATAIGTVVGAAVVAAHNQWRKAAKERPLYENGRRDEIIKMIRQLTGSVNSLEDKMSTAVAKIEDRLDNLERDAQEALREFDREHRRMHKRIETLEQEGP